MKKYILCFLMLISSASFLRADNVTFQATVNSSTISMDDVMQLTLTASGVNTDLDPVSLPVIDGFAAKYLGPQTSVSIINGSYHSERSFVYNLFPNKVGHFQIPVITATIAGHTYSTSPINIEVTASAPQTPASNANAASGDQGQAPTEETLKNDIFVVASVDNSDVYLSQRVELTIKLLINGVNIKDVQYPQFSKDGLNVDEYAKAIQSSEILNGVRYDTIIFKTNIYPNRVGDITLGPVQIPVNVLYKAHSENPINPDTNPFGADIFNGFFDTYATRSVTAKSHPVQLHVLPLPENNRPNDFNGAIGQFDFQATVAPLDVKAGDPLTLKMNLKGNGNFKSIKLPDFQATDFKTYAPQIKGGLDEKSLEEVIIPTSVDIKEVPAISFSYFDTSIKDYRTITQGPFAIHVLPPSADQEFKAVGFADVSKTTSLASANQFFLGKMFNGLYRFLNKLLVSVWFWICLGIILLAATALFFWRRFQDRLVNDPAFARRLKAIKEAKQALIPAEEFILMGKTKDLYTLLSKVLREFLANKWHRSSAALSVDGIVKNLKIANIEDSRIAEIKNILEQADLVCFAGVNRDASQMRADLTQTEVLINYLQQHLK